MGRKVKNIVIKWHILITAVSLLLALLYLREVWGFSPNQSSPSSLVECNGLDIVVIIDQSESMGGAEGIPPNDPENFRIDAAREVIVRLGENRLYFCTDVVHRVAILSFGDGPLESDGTEIDLPFTEIAPDPKAEFVFWKERRQQLMERIQPKHLGATDFATAFRKAKELFDQLPDFGNKKALILLTDGGPCVQELGCKIKESTFAPGPYLTGLKKQIEKDFPFEEGKGYYIWVVAMHDRGSDYLNEFIGGDIQKTLGEFWEEDIAKPHGGSLIKLSKNREDIPATFFEILQNVLGTGEVKLLECGSHLIKPYVNKVIFIFFKGKRETGVSIEHTLPDGTEVLIRSGKASAPGIEIDEHLVDGHTERYIISKPDPGIWTLTADDCEGVRIYEELIEPRIRKIEPEEQVPLYEVSPFYDPKAPRYLIYRVEERDTGKEFPEYAQYPLTIRAQITSPSGQQYELVLSSIGDGMYKSSTPILVGEEGDYPIHLIGEAENVGQVFSVDGGHYTVYVEIKPFGFEISEPQEHSIIPLNEPRTGKLRPVHVQLHLVDANGEPLVDERDQPMDPTRIFPKDLEKVFEITLRGTKGQPEIRAFMSPDPNRPGYFAAELHGVNVEDTYTLQIAMKGKYREDRFRPLKTVDSLPFRMEIVKYFDFQFTSPTSDAVLPIHGPLWNAFLGRVETPEIRLRVMDEAGNYLDPNEVFVLPAEAFEVRLKAPDGSTEKIEGAFVLKERTQLWASSIPAWQAKEGTYILEAKVNSHAVKKGYAPVERVRQVTFTRQDALLTNPLVWRPVGGVIAFLLALTGWAVRLRLRPAGFVTFIHRKTGMVLHEENLSNPFRGWFHRYVSKSRGLKDLDINKLVVTKGKPDEDGRRTANLIIYDQKGNVWVQEESLPSGEDFWLDAEVKVKYD
jgi:hypothetical protein